MSINDEEVQGFLGSLNPRQRIAMNIAREQLQTSFSLDECTGFLGYKKKELAAQHKKARQAESQLHVDGVDPHPSSDAACSMPQANEATVCEHPPPDLP
jgi:hypothetical protein